MNEELPPKTMAHSVLLRIRDDIIKSRLAPGDRLRLDALRVA